MKIEIWSDVVCPFCYIGKKHLELALAQFPHADSVSVNFRSFELDPTIPAEPTGPLVDLVAKKYSMSHEQAVASQEDIAHRAAEVGLTFNWQDAKFGNTFDAHRLIHLASAHGKQLEAEELLFHAYFTEGLNPASHEVLRGVASRLELPADSVESLLSGDDYADAVREDEALAQQMGIRGVPFFVIDNKYAINGAQPVEVILNALNQIWEQDYAAAQPVPNLINLKDANSGETCGPDGCC